MKRVIKKWWFLIVCLTGVITGLLFFNLIIKPIFVLGSSMEPTLEENDLIWINKVSDDIERFDIIYFKNNSYKNNVIKRVIALPNESIQIDEDGKILINDKVLEEDYGKEEIETRGLAKSKITLKDDEYFVLGDNRNKSTDSRSAQIGLVKKEQIIGKKM